MSQGFWVKLFTYLMLLVGSEPNTQNLFTMADHPLCPPWCQGCCGTGGLSHTWSRLMVGGISMTEAAALN